jgi:hypothetical protein
MTDAAAPAECDCRFALWLCYVRLLSAGSGSRREAGTETWMTPSSVGDEVLAGGRVDARERETGSSKEGPNGSHENSVRQYRRDRGIRCRDRESGDNGLTYSGCRGCHS